MGGLLGLKLLDVVSPVEAIGKVLDYLFTSDEERLSHKEVMSRLAQSASLAQSEISMVEASHRSIFVAGARPFILWVCGSGLAFVFVINPIIQWLTGEPGPEMPLEAMLSLVTAVLGLGGMRTYEKIKGRAK